MDTPFNPQPNQYPNPNGYNPQMGNGEPPMPPQNPGQLPPQNTPSFGGFPPQSSPSFGGGWGEASWGEPPRPKRSLLWLWITLAVLVVAGAIVAIVLLTKDSSSSDTKDEKTETVKESDDDYEDYDDPKAYGNGYEDDEDEDDFDDDNYRSPLGETEGADDDLYNPRSSRDEQGETSSGYEEEVSEEDKAVVKFVFDSFENVTDEEIMQTFQYLLNEGRFTPKQYRYAVREHLRRQQQYVQ